MQWCNTVNDLWLDHISVIKGWQICKYLKTLHIQIGIYMVRVTVDCTYHELYVHFLLWCYSMWYGEERPRWLGPLSYDYPKYLTGELPGDYGFDVAGLGKDPVAFQKYFKYVMIFTFDHCCLNNASLVIT